ncbi:hypothetical protein DBR00_16205 [Pseudomonas sp. HMWF032]|uniref:hypothetical protein n=1 Tax=Pseudomonas sp. HMWF032 TaxID=2056866 RepID=UPI000D3A93F6|nr:hypothetical protein [Pseudomonas sp. HMWF032]PTS82665.1 hypothetical protein DBR00_16205 [Pseudomonas sp. HMWF032]PTT83495.1 hypothetical protein DBR41_10575 [Pseudomonas sp. HMWF010]
MNISISKVMTKDGEQWSVNAGTIQLMFRDQESAVEFSEKLKDRIEAPHDLPVAQLEKIVEALESETA